MEVLRPGVARCLVAFLLACSRETLANVFLNSPRGSNNKMTEQSNNAANPNRLFKSDNHPSGGYQIGDNCVPNCKAGNEGYDATKTGSQEGQMYFYAGSELYIEWATQHGCGTPGKNTECQVILQYMCSSFSATRPGSAPLRDGKDPDSATRRRTAGGNNPNAAGADPALADDLSRGRHESFESFDICRKRRRNKGLFSGGQNLNVNVGGAATRQNAAGTRFGMECGEERDYYPYWHPTEWKDIAIFSSEADKRCDFYRSESQNVKAKGYCNSPKLSPEFPQAVLPENEQISNIQESCGLNEGEEWIIVDPWGDESPECKALVDMEDNLLGTNQGGKFQSYTWKIPENDACTLRIRYNITSGDFANTPEKKTGSSGDAEDFDYFFDLDSRFNLLGREPLQSNPKEEFIGLGWNVAGPLQMQVNTAQFGRTFQDRSHTFRIRKRPSSLGSDVRIVNYNVRGRRGDLVEVFPAATYGFVPPDLVVNQGDFLHFQWTGSDANANGNSGHGRRGTDRSNLVQIESRATNVPLPYTKHSLFFDSTIVTKTEPLVAATVSTAVEQTCTGQLFSSCGHTQAQGLALVAKFAFLDQQSLAKAAGATCPENEVQAQGKNDNADDNCLQLNFAPAYFDGGLVEMTVVGDHHVASTRNNDYSNVSQKATIKVLGRKISWWVVVPLVAGILLGTMFMYEILIAAFAYYNPTSDMFSSKNRPMLLKAPLLRWGLQKKEEERRSYRRALRDLWSERARAASPGAKLARGGASPSISMPASLEEIQPRKKGFCSKLVGVCCDRQNMSLFRHFRIENLFLFIFWGTNIFTMFIGFMRNYDGGYNKWFCMAKVGGYTLDFNLACILIPTLRSIHTVARPVRALDKLFNQEPIHFHIMCAGMVAFGAMLHIIGHVIHIAYIVQSAPFEEPITIKQKLSGMTAFQLLFNPANRLAGFTGVIISYLMTGMFMTAVSQVRRHTFDFHKMPRSFREFRSWFLLLGALLLFFPFWLPQRLWKRFLATRRQPFRPGENGKLGGFKIFWEFHKCWKPCFVLLLVHGPNCWIWFMWPLVMVLCDRLLMQERRKITSHLRSAELLKGKVLKLTFALPTNFTYQAGTYVLINCDSVYGDEWHPFTLTSAPEENFLSVHIRCADDLDFCSALRRRLVETPAMELSQGAAEKLIKSSRIRVLYSPYTAEALFDPFAGAAKEEAALSRPWCAQIFDTNEASVPSKTFEVSLADKRNEDLEAAADRLNTARVVENQPRREISEVTLDDIIKPQRPKDVIQMSLDGPHGAPSELVWRNRVCVLVGAGIGVTPFAAILRSITLRTPTKAEILAGPAGGSLLTKRNWQKKKYEVDEEYVVDWKPCEHVHFYWLCKDNQEFEWFYGLLSAAVAQASKGRIEVNLFKTGETELSAVKQRREDFREFFGRPNWNRIFPKLAETYPGESVGCFYCGAPALRNDLATACNKASLTNEHGTRFTLYAENF